jgi:ethanolamine permease
MFALFRLRRTHPTLERPFKVPFYPVSPAVALGIAVISLLSMVYHHFKLFVISLILMGCAYARSHFFVSAEKKLHAEQN